MPMPDLDDELALACPAELTQRCDEHGRSYDTHACIRFEGHDGSHECGCGLRWTEPDDG